MASVFDVAQYILQQLKGIPAIKMQKLVYYCQAWYLAWNEGSALFSEPIEAWINGPVVRDLYNKHRGQLMIYTLPVGRADSLDYNQKSAIRQVLDNYGEKDISWLILKTHEETPWKDARQGLAPMEPSNNEITLQTMFDFYHNKDISECVK